MNIIDELKALPFTLEVEHDKDGVFVEAREFDTAYSEEATLDDSLKALARSMKEWGRLSAPVIEQWGRGREEQIPYLLKVLVSSEEELLGCLRSAKCVSI